MLLFILVPLIILAIVLGGLEYLNRSLLRNYKLSQDVNTLILGDSHVEAAIDDSLNPHFINLSQSGESYIYTLAKLEYLVTSNRTVKTVILGYGCHNISEYFDYAAFGENAVPTFSNFFLILPASRKIEILSKSPSLFYQSLTLILKNGILNLNREEKEYSFLGSFVTTTTPKLMDTSSVKRRIEAQFYKDNVVTGFSEINIDYLKKIIDFCNANQLSLYLLNTPVHPIYQEQIPPKFITKYYSLALQQNCKIIEFKNAKFESSDFLPDGDHLRLDAARTTTRDLFEMLKKF